MENLTTMQTPRVFIVDDDELVRHSVAPLLEESEIEVKTFESAESFLECAPKYDVGCLIADVQMPGMSGLELIENLRANESNGHAKLLPLREGVDAETGHVAGLERKVALPFFLEDPFPLFRHDRVKHGFDFGR